MARIKKRILRWKASPSPQVAGYKLYWSESGSVNYDSDCVKLGNVTEIVLPDDVKAFAEISGPVELGITAIDELGNESDLITIKTPYQFKVPHAPAELRLESRNAPSAGEVEIETGSESVKEGPAEDQRQEAREPIRIFDSRLETADRNDVRRANEPKSTQDLRSAANPPQGMPRFIGQDE